jgi:RNase P subunit RPR2
MATHCPKTGRFNSFKLTDDGTLDTVVACSECGQELRYNHEPSEDGVDWETADCQPTDARSYNEFVDWAKLDAAEQHEEKA